MKLTQYRVLKIQVLQILRNLFTEYWKKYLFTSGLMLKNNKSINQPSFAIIAQFSLNNLVT